MCKQQINIALKSQYNKTAGEITNLAHHRLVFSFITVDSLLNGHSVLAATGIDLNIFILKRQYSTLKYSF